jgi:hypothetical protein
MGEKKIKCDNKQRSKRIAPPQSVNTDKETPFWCFDNPDNDGMFRLSKETVNSELLIDKLLSLSKLTWAQIKTATHDESKSKNHELDYANISSSAKERIKAKKLSDEDIDALFSIAFTNKIRLIGLKKGRTFHAIWYDSNHEFYLSSK